MQFNRPAADNGCTPSGFLMHLMDLHSRFEIAADPRNIRTVRAAVFRDPTLDKLHDDVRPDVVLIVSELVSNAVAASPAQSPIVISLTRSADAVVVEVTNHGAMSFDRTTFSLPEPDVAQGRGLGIVSRLATTLTASTSDGQTTVSARVPTDRGTQPDDYADHQRNHAD